MSFKDRNWHKRFEQMGDLAEGVFEWVCEHALDRGYVRFGLNRPPLRMSLLPARLRYTPDYLMSDKFVEVQGFGRDQRLKLKHDKLGAMHWWNDLHPLHLFVYDSHNQRYCWLSLDILDQMIDDGVATLEQFPEGKTYYAFPAAAIEDGWWNDYLAEAEDAHAA